MRGTACGERTAAPPFFRAYEQVFVELSHFMWAFSQEDLDLCSAANAGVRLAAANPSATSAVTSFFMEHLLRT